jgi:hypothetical protein
MGRELVIGLIAILVPAFLFGCVGQGPSTSGSNTPGIPGAPMTHYVFPKSDVNGKDLSDVPRYPGSIRMSYEEEDGDIYIDYYVDGDKVNDVSSFYSDKMPQNGWTQTETSTEGGSFQVNIPGYGSMSMSNNVSFS